MATMVVSPTPSGDPPRAKRKTIGANGILQFANLIVACLVASAFFYPDLSDHPYMDRATVGLGLVLCLQTYVALRFERRNPDPFVLLAAYVLTIFYSLRLYTLALYPVQAVFLRYPYGPADSNHALLFILVANVFLYAGLYWPRLKPARRSPTVVSTAKRPRVMFVLFAVSVVFGLFIQNQLPAAVQAPVGLVYNSFLTPNLILIVLATYVITYRQGLPRLYVLGIVAAAALLAGLQTLGFSRSGLLTLFEQALILILATAPMIRIPRKYMYVGFVLLPLVITVAVDVYALSTITRRNKGDRGGDLAERVELMRESRRALEDDGSADGLVGQAFSRAGYFDYSAEIIAHRQEYSRVFTFRNYAASIVDNLLTPGFDVFDMTRISASLKYVYSGWVGDFSRREEQRGGHSDQFGLYGEMYALVGYGACVVIFAMAFVVKRAFRGMRSAAPHIHALKQVLVLQLFLRQMNSFGMDWVLLDLVTMLVGFSALSKMLPHRKAVGSTAASRSRLGELEPAPALE